MTREIRSAAKIYLPDGSSHIDLVADEDRAVLQCTAQNALGFQMLSLLCDVEQTAQGEKSDGYRCGTWLIA